jgi:hypothetical protein
VKENKIVRSTDFDRRPAWFRLLNKAWKMAGTTNIRRSLDKDELIKAARKNTGLQDLGKDFHDEPLDRLLQSIIEEARLNPAGVFITRKRMVNLLSIRLRAEKWFKDHPEILDRELYPVTMIIGAQRTGTTKLHRLLASDPENRTLASWEAINPVPLNENFRKKEKRIAIARTSENALKFMAPGFFSIHPVEHKAPEEDILLLDTTFLSTTPEATMHVPSYAAWLESTDQSFAYEYAVKLLKFLQWQKPAKRWVLKSPHHLEFLDLVDKHYGDVTYLWTHRRLDEAIPSFLSMVSHSRMIFSDEVEMHKVAEHWVRKTGFILGKGASYRANKGANKRFTDIIYPKFTEDPFPCLRNIYSQFGGISKEQMERFLRTEQENPKGKYGRHIYNLADFGLSEKDILNFLDGYEPYHHELKNDKVRFSPDNSIFKQN